MGKILIDANTAVVRRKQGYLTGIGRTTLDLITSLSKKGLPFRLAYYVQHLRGDGSSLERLNVSRVRIPLPGAQQYKNVITRFRVKEIVSGYDLLHVPHNYDTVADPGKTVVTLHDAMFFSYPEEFLGHTFARKYYPRLAKSCRAIVTCSESSKADIVRYMNIVPEKITVIPWGVSGEMFFPEERGENKKGLLSMGLNRPYFLMVSCDIGRKNTLSLLRAYRLFLEKKAEHDLVLVWNRPPQEIVDEFSREIREQRVHFLGGISDQTLRILYCGATASFFPSKYEGFGLPVIESMACGTPVVTCRNSSLTEAGGEAALYADPDNIGQMADYMREFEDGSLDLSVLRKRSLKHASKFNWEDTADKYIRFYQANL